MEEDECEELYNEYYISNKGGLKKQMIHYQNLGAKAVIATTDETQYKTDWMRHLYQVHGLSLSIMVIVSFLGKSVAQSGEVVHWANPEVNHRSIEPSHMEKLVEEFKKGQMDIVTTMIGLVPYVGAPLNDGTEPMISPQTLRDTFDFDRKMNDLSLIHI